MPETPKLPETIRFGRAICGDLVQAERREWWLANGRGGYAAGNIAGTLSRRYHGLLIASVQPPLGRCLVFAKADAQLLYRNRVWPLSTNRWSSGVIEPQGFVHIECFRLEGRMPVWCYALSNLRLEIRIWMEPGANTVYVAYRLQSTTDTRQSGTPILRLRLLCNARDQHTSSQRDSFHLDIIAPQSANAPVLTVSHTKEPFSYKLNIHAAGGAIRPDRTWYENFDLIAERERGLPDQDCHLSVGIAEFPLQTGVWCGLAASLEEDVDVDLGAAMQRFQDRDLQLLADKYSSSTGSIKTPPWIDQLSLAADSFLFQRGSSDTNDTSNQESVIAGYPWFGDWGRDTMIALPGLTLATGRYARALKVLKTFARFVDRGMLPNVLPGRGEKAEYNTVDAALWYLEAWRAYIEVSQDEASLREVFPVLESIIEDYRHGTRYGIHMDETDGLLSAGEAGAQLTWMDAKIGDWVVTPRIGKAVEINALWYNGLMSMRGFAERLGLASSRYDLLAQHARQGFQRFIKTDQCGLYDVLDGPEGDDSSLRPNQIFAVSLEHTALDSVDQAQVVRVCGVDLLTSYGLRSVSPQHPDYCPYYQGAMHERDAVYHQGTVWAWLLGHYVLAEYRVTGDLKLARTHLEAMRDHLCDAGLGTISEIFDGATPHTPRGAPAQAWSVACILEAWWRLDRSERADQREMNGAKRNSSNYTNCTGAHT